METSSYQVLFEGRVLDGKDPAEVKSRLSRLFGMSSTEIESLFSGKPRLLKTVPNLEEAEKMVTVIERAGAIATLQRSEPKSKSRTKPKAPTSEILGKVGLAYQLDITRAALLVGLIWLAHLLIIGTLSVALLYHLFFNLGLYGKFGAAGLLLHTIPAVIGALLLGALIKPLLPMRLQPATDLELELDQQTELSRFLETLCNRIGAPRPESISVDSGAGIELEFGPIPEIATTPSKLRLGLTLVSGLNVTQLAGLLGRELGYVAGGQATRRTQFVRASHQRLLQAAFGEDQLDRLLGVLEQQPKFASVSRIGMKLIALSRKLHRGLLQLVHKAAAKPLAKLEERLDGLQAQLSGSDAFRGTIARQHLLTLALEAAGLEQHGRWDGKGELAESLPAAALLLTRERIEQFQRDIRKLINGEGAGEFATRPTDFVRIESVEKQPQQAQYTDLRQARQLVANFDRLARRTSYLWYRNALRLPATSDRLLPVARESGNMEQLLRRYLMDIQRAPVAMTPPLLEEKADSFRQKLQGIALHLKEEQTRIGATLQQYRRIEPQLMEANAREVIAGAKLDPIAKVDLEAIQRECRKLENEEEKTLKKLQEPADLLSQRLAIGLAQLSARSPRHAQEIERFRAALRRIDQLMPMVTALRLDTVMLELLLGYLPTRNRVHADRVEERTTDLRGRLLAVRLSLREAPWPFRPDVRDSLANHAIEGDIETASPSELLDMADTVHSRIQLFRGQILAHLIQLALVGEKSLTGG